MTEQNLQRVIRAILVVATTVLAVVLGVGVFRGELHGAAASGGLFDSSGGRAAADLFDPAQDQGLLLLADDGRRLLTVSVPGGEVTGAVDLPGRAAAIVPTPGGVSVWVTFTNRQEIEIYDTTELTHQATVRPEGGAGDTPGHLTFSENGDTLFVTWQETERISIYRHEMRELSLRREIPATDASGTAGPVLRNRRATRLYRADLSGDLAAFFALNGQRLESIEIPGGGLQPDAPPVFTDDSTAAWAITADGELVGIDEAEATAHRHEVNFPPALGNSPVVIRGQETRGLVVQSDERGVHRVDLFDIQNPVESGHLEPASLDGEERIVSLVAAGNGGALLLTSEGRLITIDGRSLTVVETAEIREEGEPIRPERAVVWAINEEGNFACF